ncbi:bromodomain-containing protein [Aspergillus stella-maris]|uniref:bromodomain-containing protein n=1 Tax=Aspergillus stella-maris TaxID=1810926 RepID=UPI003CCDF96F
MDKLSREPRHGPQFTELRRFLNQIQKHKQAWPFLHPVNRDEVPDYYNVIVEPLDLSTIEERLEQDSYAAPRNLVRDLKLIFSNCRQYNDAATVYAKCAEKLERFMWDLIKEVRSGLSCSSHDCSRAGFSLTGLSREGSLLFLQ